MANENRATYRYTADEQREMDILRDRYTPDKLNDQLFTMREVDQSVTRCATVKAVSFGFSGMLVMGLGLAMVLSLNWMIPGIIIGCCGIAVMAVMPAAYERILRHERKRAAQKMKEPPDKAKDTV